MCWLIFFLFIGLLCVHICLFVNVTKNEFYFFSFFLSMYCVIFQSLHVNIETIFQVIIIISVYKSTAWIYLPYRMTPRLTVLSRLHPTISCDLCYVLCPPREDKDREGYTDPSIQIIRTLLHKFYFRK